MQISDGHAYWLCRSIYVPGILRLAIALLARFTGNMTVFQACFFSEFSWQEMFINFIPCIYLMFICLGGPLLLASQTSSKCTKLFQQIFAGNTVGS